MHVLILPSWYPMHYAPTRGIFFQEQAQALQKQGVRVGIIYPNFRSLRTVELGEDMLRDHFQTSFREESGIPTFRFHGWNPGTSWLRMRAFRWQARRLMRRYITRYGEPDLIHAHSALWGGVAAQEISQEYRLPYVITEHSSRFARGQIREWQKAHVDRAFERARIVWAVSNAFKQKIKQYVSTATIRVIPNMVDTSIFKLPPRSRTTSPFTFLVVASLTSNKGIDLLLKAFTQAFRGKDNIKLEIGGEGEEREYLKELSQELEIDKQVRFLGMLSRKEVREAMWRANAFVLPSHIETFGVVLIEAMATGLPVIATRSGGPQDILQPDVGKLVPADDPRELSKGMRLTASNIDEMDPQNIRMYVVQKFGHKRGVAELKKFYRQVSL